MRQLIFTSAVIGLAPGRSGFCTVARHASLRERTVAELEKMSDYKPSAGTRPTVFLFRVYSGGNEPLYILTRAGDAGLDAFGRPNHIVHHLIFRENELPLLLPPAEIALRFRGWCKKYEGAPMFFPEDEPLPPEILRAENESLLPAKRWEALTGDAGNAAQLCPHGDARATVFLGDASMTETVLGLFAESAETLGGANAWEIAFSTGICSQADPGRFLWRMVDEPEIKVRHPGDFVLDFLAPLGFLHAPKTEFAAFARSGVFPKKIAKPLSKKESAETGTVVSKAPIFSEKTFNPELVPAETPNAPRVTRFADIAGTAIFLGISAVVVVLVVALVIFLNYNGPAKIANRPGFLPVAEKDAVPTTASGAYRKILEEKITAGDFRGAAEAWTAFAAAFPQEAEKLRASALPRFKLKVAGAYADHFAARLRPLDFGMPLSDEEKRLISAELDMFRRVCAELELTPQRIQKKNLAVIRRAEDAVADEE